MIRIDATRPAGQPLVILISTPLRRQGSTPNEAPFSCSVEIVDVIKREILGDTPLDALGNAAVFARAYVAKRIANGDALTF